MKNAPIYLDFNASTPLDPRVAEVMQDMLSDAYGNPSSTHWAGEPARVAVERARRQVADLLGCKPQEVIFTSGGSESNNMAIKGIAEGHDPEQVHIITSQVEHPAVTEPCLYLERRGATITWLPADRFGQVKPADVEAAIRPQTTLVTIMHANNEVGTIQPIEDIARIASAHGVPMHTDAAQSVGKISTRVDELGVDMLTIAGHKLYAPKGVGALFVREGIELPPLVHGAGHERGRRAGTESALLNAALGKACVLARDLSGMNEIKALGDRFWQQLQEALGERVVMNGHPDQRLPNTLNLSFPGQVGADVLAAMPELAASTGSACHAGMLEMSPVLSAMGVPAEIGAGAIRFSLGRSTKGQELDWVARRLSQIVLAP
jgi:cysteine desulfurase